MKIVCVMPIFKRQNITLKTLELMKKQTLPFHEIIVIGSSEVDKNTAKKAGVVYINHTNSPLSNKWQAGVYKAKDFNPDAVLINGSDSWLSTNWNSVTKQYLEQGFHLIGKTQWHSCRVNPKQPLLIVQAAYKTRKDPVGAGRLFSKEALERANWMIYPKGHNSGLDGKSFRLILPKITAQKVKLINEHKEVIIVGIKSTTWKTKTNFAFVQRTYGKNVIQNPERWIESHFPGALKTFKELVPNVKI